jgi:hypothetical protein
LPSVHLKASFSPSSRATRFATTLLLGWPRRSLDDAKGQYEADEIPALVRPETESAECVDRWVRVLLTANAAVIQRFRPLQMQLGLSET